MAAAGGVGNLSLGGADPRTSLTGEENVYNNPQIRAFRDPNVTFEEYHHYAKLARAEEDSTAADEPPISFWRVFWPSKSNKAIAVDIQRRNSQAHGLYPEEKKDEAVNVNNERPELKKGHIDISDEEWLNAGRAIRTASGAAVFYLITTDILGPFALPFAFGTVGFGPGVSLFTIFAVLAGYGGYLLHSMFMGLDSYQYPTRAYGDVGYKIYGQWARIPINFLQAIQLILTVSLITISNGQALSIMTKFNLCYVACIVILVVAGMIVGQIRTLQKFGWLANVAVFFNVFIMILTMAVAATSGPNYGAAQLLSAGATLGGTSVKQQPDGSYPSVEHYGGIPANPLGFIGAVNGAMSTVFAYGGANVFNEFMAEMKRPRDFLHAMWAAQFFIWFVYMFYGLFMYGYQGQYSVNPSPQSISPYWALVVANLFYILSAGCAAVLYGNIGVKVIYNNIFVEIFKLPPLTDRFGKIMWVGMIPVYWAVAFAIGGAIPNFAALVGLVAAVCIVQFTYSFPPFLHVGYMIQKNSVLPGEGFDPATGNVIRHDSGIKRAIRGLFGGTLLETAMNLWNIIYCLASLSMAGLGAYAAIELIKITFESSSNITSFSCKSPLNFEIL